MRNQISKCTTYLAVMVGMLAISLPARGQTTAEDARTAGLEAYLHADFAEAERYFSQALALAESTRERYSVALNRLALAHVYHVTGRLEKAARTYDDALSRFKEENRLQEAAMRIGILSTVGGI